TAVSTPAWSVATLIFCRSAAVKPPVQAAPVSSCRKAIAILAAKRPNYPSPGGGGGGGHGPSTPSGGKPDEKGKDKGKEDKKPSTDGTSKGEEIVKQLGLKEVDADSEKQTNLDRAQQILKKIDQALSKQKYDKKNDKEVKQIQNLLEKLKENQKETVVVHSPTLNQQVEGAIKHLEELKKQTPATSKQLATEDDKGKS
ncbi:4694_t:CDS:2, partial [Funneliformis caledonium]